MLSNCSRIRSTFPADCVRSAPTPRRYRALRLANAAKYCTYSPPSSRSPSIVRSTAQATRILSIGQRVSVLGRSVLYQSGDSPSFPVRTGVSPPFFRSNRSFSSTTVNMAGTKIDGASIAKSIRERLNGEIHKAQTSNPRFKPSLVIFQGNYLFQIN